MSRLGWVITAGVCAAGLIAGVALRPLVLPSGHIALHPAEVQLKEGHIEGEPLEIHFELSNESRSAVTVTTVSASCGCMALSGNDGPIETPFTLDAGSTLSVALNIATAARVGTQTFVLGVAAEGPRGSPLETRAVVRVNLLGALRASQEKVVFRDVKQGTTLSAEIDLADMLPNPGVEIREVRTSDQDSLRVELEPASGPSRVFGETVAAWARARLKLSYVPTATEGRIQEMITIVPRDSRYPTLQIPVYCEMAEPPIRFRPRGLSIPAEAEPAFRRSVTLESQAPITSLSVVACPPGVDVQIEQSDDERTIIVTGDTSKFQDDASEIRFLIDGVELGFPIRVIQ